jgi:cytolysin (calcineurin-like family phosphatase)
MTDVHLRGGHGITDLQHTLHPYFMKQIGNNGWNWNVSNAGFPADPIAHPLAVVSTGDETDDGQQTSLGAFRLLYEAGRSTDALALPLFAGYGNHDVQNDCEFNNCAKRMLDYSARTAACIPNGVDSESRNYSWDWGKYHMIQLNNWAGDTMGGKNNSYSPTVTDTHGSGMPWLIQDLAAHVGGSGQPVIIFQHYGWDPFSLGWWTDADRQNFLNAIKDYNVVAIISGHDHNMASYSVPVTDSQGNHKLLDDIVGGTGGQGGRGEFFVARLTDQFLDILPVEWSDPTVNPPVSSPYPRNVGIDSIRTPFFNNVQGCRKWVGPALRAAPLALGVNSNILTITNHTSNSIQGPFAVQFKSLASPLTAQPEQVLFT